MSLSYLLCPYPYPYPLPHLPITHITRFSLSALSPAILYAGILFPFSSFPYPYPYPYLPIPYLPIVRCALCLISVESGHSLCGHDHGGDRAHCQRRVHLDHGKGRWWVSRLLFVWSDLSDFHTLRKKQPHTTISHTNLTSAS